MTTLAKPVRCAIYTRKSSEEGLEQRFNSLHAQREACEAYIRSQIGEGWLALRSHYDDGGFSGGEMNRPAMRRILADVSAGRIDVVVVYKVDRLTRSLADFARIIETFDSQRVSFVSVTQGFNTTTAAGRLTLNVLLSFAQFERDVTGERIRDKVAASKAKGMWMGGHVPLGYDRPEDRGTRALVVNLVDAQKIKLVFSRFLALQSLSALQLSLQAEGMRPRPLSPSQAKARPRLFSTGALRHMLANRVYIGQIVHKGAVYPGRHHPIIDAATFDAVQAVLAENSSRRRNRKTRAGGTLLRGLVFDRDGQVMVPTFGGKAGKRYHYYASPPVKVDGDDDAIRRVRGSALDDLVTSFARRVTGDKEEALAALVGSIIRRIEVGSAAVDVVVDLRGLALLTGSVRPLDSLRASLAPSEQVLSDPQSRDLVRIVLPVRLVMWGGRKWIFGPPGQARRASAAADLELMRRLKAAHGELRACELDPDASLNRLYRARGPRSSGAGKFTQLALLAPDLQQAVMEGRHFAGAAAVLSGEAAIPVSWAAQRRLFGAEALPRTKSAAL